MRFLLHCACATAATGVVQHEPVPYLLLHQAAVTGIGALHRQQQHLARSGVSRRVHARVRCLLLFDRQQRQSTARSVPAWTGGAEVYDVESGTGDDKWAAGGDTADVAVTRLRCCCYTVAAGASETHQRVLSIIQFTLWSELVC
jgi:hypothetical protein